MTTCIKVGLCPCHLLNESGFGSFSYKNNVPSVEKIEPNVITLFSKKGGTFSTIHYLPSVNWKGYIPGLNFYYAIQRIVRAVQSLFELLKNPAVDSKFYWEAVKNIFRGLVEFLPLVGGLSLLFFDITRNELYYTCKVYNEIDGQDNIIGIAIDGKVINTVSLPRTDSQAVCEKKVFKIPLVNLDSSYRRGFSDFATVVTINI